jgi:hypothetical protein
MSLQIQTGHYTGTGATHNITGLGFTPKLVIITTPQTSGGNGAQWSTGSDITSSFGENGTQAGVITSLDADGFTLGSSAYGNNSGTVYSFIAFAGDDIVAGTYTGNGSDNRNITGVGFLPVWAIIQGGTEHTIHKMLSTGASTDSAQYGTVIADLSNSIQNLNGDGFQLGTSSTVNANAVAYRYVCFKNTANIINETYTGNGSDNVDRSTLNLLPVFVFIKNTTTDQAVIRTNDFSGDSTSLVRANNAYSANKIQSFSNYSFQVGTDATVNGNTKTYHSIAIAADVLPLTTSLISYYKLDESSGNASDSVGSNTLTNSNVTYSAGKLNNGAVFNGSSASLTGGDIFDFAYTGTISFAYWIKPTNFTGNQQHLNKKDPSGAFDGWQIYTNGSGVLNFDYAAPNATGIEFVTDSAVLTTGVWQHVAFSYNNKVLVVYVNGVSVPITKTADTVNQSTNNSINFNIGSRGNSDRWLNGSIDELGIWSRALTADEVSQLYNSNRALAYPLTAPTLYGGVAYYKLDESSGDASDDIGGNTLTNTNVTYGTGKINNGAVFNGTTDSLSTTTITNLNFTGATPFSFSTWSNQTTLANDGYLISHIKATANNEGYVLQIDNTGKVLFYIGDNNTGSSLLYLTTPSSSITTGAWYNVVVTYDGTKTPSGTKIYVNGVSQSLTTVFNNFTGSSVWTGPFQIGSRESNSINFAGTIDEVVVFNRSLTSTEVTELYASGSGKQYPWTGIVYSIVCTVGTFALTGVNIIIQKALNLVTSVGTFTLTGIDAILKRGFGILCATGNFTLEGKDILIIKAITIALAVGEFTVTGVNILISRGYKLIASVGTFILTGINLVLSSSIDLLWTKQPQDGDADEWVETPRDL